MSRGRKLIIVGLVLAAGLALAWPFRKTKDETKFDSVAQAPVASPDLAQSEPERAQAQASQQPPPLGSPAPHVVAKMMSLADGGKPITRPPASASFDLANHPALAATPAPPSASPVTPAVPPATQASETRPMAHGPVGRSHARPAYPTAEQDRRFDAEEHRPREVRHVVQNSDTLEKLAKRYLGDEGRALEIFDLNRDVLDNPHLLPIDAELRIPRDARVSLD